MVNVTTLPSFARNYYKEYSNQIQVNEFQKSEEGNLNKENRIRNFQKLEELVNKKGITFYRLAKELGLSKTLFSEWKRGKSMPKTDKLIKIADYFGVSIAYFF